MDTARSLELASQNLEELTDAAHLVLQLSYSLVNSSYFDALVVHLCLELPTDRFLFVLDGFLKATNVTTLSDQCTAVL